MSDKRAPRRSLDDWMELVTECRQSGLTDAAWCEAQGMRVCQDIIREEYDALHPVWRNYFSLCVKYKCGLETK